MCERQFVTSFRHFCVLDENSTCSIFMQLDQPWIIYEWMGNSTLQEFEVKALDDFDWLSQSLE